MNSPTSDSQASGEDNDAQVLQALEESSTLEKQIHRMEMELQNLKNTHTAKIGYINRHSRLLSPISRIPLELQQDIFEYAVNSSGNLGTRTVLTITSVCQEWRNNAVKMSLLWNRLSLSLPKYPLPHPFYWQLKGAGQIWDQCLDPGIDLSDLSAWNTQVEVLLEFAKTFATRSGNYPLTLTFDATKLFAWEGPPADDLDFYVLTSKMLDRVILWNHPVAQLLDFLCGLAPRLRDVNLSLPCATPSTGLLRILGVLNRDVSPQLRDVKIVMDLKNFWIPDHREPKARAALEAMKLGPSLPQAYQDLCPSYSLTLRSMSRRFYALPVKWSGLTSLTFTSDAVDLGNLETTNVALVIGVLLRNCPSLEHCDFSLPESMCDDAQGPHSMDDVDDSTLTKRRIQLPRLKTLTIRRISHLPLCFAELLDLPELQELTLTCNPWRPIPEEASESSLVDFIKRFGPNLTKATIHYIDLTQTALEECLEYLPSVSFLCLNGERAATDEDCAILSSSVLAKMNGVGVGNKLLCPKLETFHCVLGPSDRFHLEPFLDFIAPRRPKLDKQPGRSDNSHSVERSFLQKGIVRIYADDGAVREALNKVKRLLQIDPCWIGFDFDLSTVCLYDPPGCT